MLICSLCFFHVASAENQHFNLPENCIEGQLRNGLKYIIMPNDQPSHNIEFRLVMNVGSILENDDERGVAHFIEHMAFAGTKHFPGRKMVDHFESIGMKFGRDINAYTGYDRTMYWLSLPIDRNNKAEINTALLVMKDWLCDINFIPERIEQEKGVILEELRGYDIGDNFYDLKIGNGKYSERMPLGREEDIKSVDSDKLKTFYKNHYSPSLATVIVVGDMDSKYVESRVKKTFSKVKRQDDKVNQNYPLTYWKGAKMMSQTDTLVSDSKLEIFVPYKTRFCTNLDNIIKERRDRILFKSIDRRIDLLLKSFKKIESEELQNYGVVQNIGSMWYLADKGHFHFNIKGKSKEDLLNTVTLTASICSGLAEEGLSLNELNHFISVVNSSIHKYDVHRSSMNWCDDFIEYAIFGERNIYSNADLKYVKNGVSQTESEELQKRMSELINCASETLLISMIRDNENLNISEEEVKNAWDKGINSPYLDKNNLFSNITTDLDGVDSNSGTQQKTQIPQRFKKKYTYVPTDIVQKKFYPNMGVTKLQLRNGVTLVMKPTSGEDKVHLSFIGKGGSANLNRQDYNVYKDASAYVDLGGIGDISADSLMNITIDNDIFMSIGVGYYYHRIMASSKAEDVSSMMQMLLQKIYHPQRAYEDFDEVHRDEIESFNKKDNVLERMLKRDVNRLISMRLDELLGDSPDGLPEQKLHDIERMNLDSLANYYTALYSDPKDVTVVFTGNFETPELSRIAVPLFSRMRKTEDLNYVEIDSYTPKGKIEETYPSDKEDLAVLQYIYPGNYKSSLRNSLTLKLLRDVLQSRMLTILREKHNIVYSPYVDLFYEGEPLLKYNYRIILSMKDENLPFAKEIVHETLNDLRSNPISDEELDKYKRSFFVTKRKSLTNSNPLAWKKALETIVSNGETLEDFENYEQCLNSITPETILEGFKNYFNEDNLIVMTQLAEESTDLDAVAETESALNSEISYTQSNDIPMPYALVDSLGCPVSYQSMLKDLSENADVVFFGELHNSPIAHWLELRVLKSMSEKGNLKLGMEQFEADNQLIVDEYFSGLISNKRFTTEARLWGNYATDYAPVVEYARQNNIPLIATNIPRRYANVVSHGGFEALEDFSQVAKSYIAPLPIPYEVAKVSSSMAQMGMSQMTQMGKNAKMSGMGAMPKMNFDNLNKAQAMKDATMAWNIAKVFKRNDLESEDKIKFFHINGSAHSDNFGGIIDFLKVYAPHLRVKVIETVNSSAEHHLELPMDEKASADYFIVTANDMVTSY